MFAYQIAERLFGEYIPLGQEIEWLPFQEDAIKFGDDHSHFILGLPMGTGKTLVALEHFTRTSPKNGLIVTTGRASISWLRTMWTWFPHILDKVFIVDSRYKPEERIKVWETIGKKIESREEFHVMINWNLLARDFKSGYIPSGWDGIYCDEYHKFLRNKDTNAHIALKALSRPVKAKAKAKSGDNGLKSFVLISGSPASNGSKDYWIPLNLFNHREFSSFWRFAYTWCNVESNEYGTRIYGSRNVEQFRKVVKPYAYVRTKKQLGIQKKLRSVLDITMDPTQDKAYHQIRRDMILELEDGPPIISLNSMTNWIKLRQLLCCPAIIHPSLGPGAGITTIMDMLEGEDDKHSVIFVPFRLAIKPLRQILEGTLDENQVVYSEKLHLPGVPIFELHGGLSLEELHKRTMEFKQRRGILLCTIAYAESFDLETCGRAFFLGAEYDPQMNYQAEDRLDRINNEHGLINIYYLLHQDTMEYGLMQSLMIKQSAVNKIHSREEVISALAK